MQKLLKNITKFVRSHKADFVKSGSRDWGYVGDLERWNELLNDILESL